ncbi:MAG: H-type lectin domain-containing protein [Stygiobacter sp.]
MKRVFASIVFLFFTASITYSQVQIQSGTFFYSKDNQNYTLHANQGKRVVEYEISFPKPFDKKPKVVLIPSLIDAEKTSQIRYNLKASGVSRDGFVLLAEVWGDTQFNAIGGFWLAHTEE